MKSLHLLARLLLSNSLPFFELLDGFWLVLQYVLISMPGGMINEEEDILTSSDGWFQGAAYVRMHEVQRFSGTEGGGSKGLSG
jgi:hypothetical protein